MVHLVFNAADHTPQGYITLTFGRSRTESRWVNKQSFSFSELASLLSNAAVGEKDGPCYTPASFSGTARRMEQATRIDVAVLDADCGHTLEEIRKAVSDKSWCAIIHSTHSHETDQTIIAADACDKWMMEHGTDDVSAYMLSKKGYLPRVLMGARILDETRDGNTRSYIVKHQPCPKFRIVLPLQESWIAADFANQNLANATWRERIGALAHALGLHHDQSCVDTSRLYYLPRHPAGAPFVHTVIHGEECPLWDLPDVTKTAPAPLLDALQSGPQPRPQSGPQPGPQLVRPDHLTFSAPDAQINLRPGFAVTRHTNLQCIDKSSF